MNVTVFQTADSQRYLQMVLQTSRTVRRYAEPRGYAQELFIGCKRGLWPWQASFNRIYVLDELIQRGWTDWAVYMDADALIADLDFNLDAYLAAKSHLAAVMTPSNATPHWWDVNSGVLMFNLRHPAARALIQAWKTLFERHWPDDVLRERSEWGNPDDQELLHDALIALEDDIRPMIHFESLHLMNALEASFIRQVLRSSVPALGERTRVIGEQVRGVLGEIDPETAVENARRENETAAGVVSQAYEALLRRPPDRDGLLHYGRLVKMLGPDTASRRIALELMQSEEYRQRIVREAAGADGA